LKSDNLWLLGSHPGGKFQAREPFECSILSFDREVLTKTEEVT
jgi:hypothetical protein